MIDARLWFMDQSVHPSATAFNLMLVKETCSFRLVGWFYKLTEKSLQETSKKKKAILLVIFNRKRTILNQVVIS
jgi:hypothetical protein